MSKPRVTDERVAIVIKNLTPEGLGQLYPRSDDLPLCLALDLRDTRASLAAAEANLAEQQRYTENVFNAMRDSLMAKLADEVRHADELKEGLAACVGERATFYAGQSQTVTWAVAIEHAEHLLAAHAARRAGKAAVEREERAK